MDRRMAQLDRRHPNLDVRTLALDACEEDLQLLAHHGRRVRMATKGDLADHDVEL